MLSSDYWGMSSEDKRKREGGVSQDSEGGIEEYPRHFLHITNHSPSQEHDMRNNATTTTTSLRTRCDVRNYYYYWLVQRQEETTARVIALLIMSLRLNHHRVVEPPSDP